MTESVNVPRCSDDPTGPAEELAAGRSFVAPRTTLLHATDDVCTVYESFVDAGVDGRGVWV